MCHIPKAAEFCICCENNESHNIASEYRKLISLISSILNVALCRTMCFICKIGTDKFCCLRNFRVFSNRQSHLCSSHWPGTELSQSSGRKQAANPQVPVPLPNQQVSEPVASGLPSFGSLAFELLASRWPGCKSRTRGASTQPDPEYHGSAVLSSDVRCSWGEEAGAPASQPMVSSTSLSSRGNLATWTQAQGSGGHLHLTEMS